MRQKKIFAPFLMVDFFYFAIFASLLFTRHSYIIYICFVNRFITKSRASLFELINTKKWWQLIN